MITTLVALPTVAVTAALFFVMATDCKAASELTGGWHAWDQLTSNPPSCVYAYDTALVIKGPGQDQMELILQGCKSVDHHARNGESFIAPSVPRCDGHEDQEGLTTECPWGDTGRIIRYSYMQCPSTMSTLGAAFGYASSIELIFTIILLGILMQCGCIEKDGTYFKELLDQAVEEKDQVTEIADTVKQAV